MHIIMHTNAHILIIADISISPICCVHAYTAIHNVQL